MVFGFRMSHHPNQLTSARASPQQYQQQQAPSVCPCASCFQGYGGEHQGSNATLLPAPTPALPPSPPSPPSPQLSGLSSSPFWGRYGRTRLGLLRGGLRRRGRSAAAMDSETRPLWEGGDVIMQEEVEEEQSVLEEGF